MNKITTFLLCLLLTVFLNEARAEKEKYQEIYIQFSKNELTVRQALDELGKLPGISVVYNSNESFLQYRIQLPTEKITVQYALDLIGDQSPVDILYNNDHIIVKPRKLAEQYILKGMVKDRETNEPLMSADLLLLGTREGTVTNTAGRFTFTLKPGNYQILCKYVGYEDKIIPVSVYNNKELSIYLDTRQHEIEEVNIMGTFREFSDLQRGRPIEKVESRAIDQLNTNDVNDALHGRINGVWSTKVSGAPGDHNKIRIRGISSIFGSTDPLYVVDGMIIPVVNFKSLGIADLNTHDISSITVLKDASSTALYGYLGGNGVILVETKKGGEGQHINFRMKQGFQTFLRRYDLMNTKDFLTTTLYADTLIHTDFYLVSPSQQIYEKYPFYRDSLGNTIGSENFQDELFQTGYISELSLSGFGRIRNMDYYLSGNYYTHEGIVVNSKYEKYTLTGNFSRQFDEKASVRLLYKGSLQENRNNLDNYMGNTVIYKGINYEPGYRFTPDSFLNKWGRLYFNDLINQWGSSMAQLSNHRYSPDMLFYQQLKEKRELSNAVNVEGIYRITNYLSFQAAYYLANKNQHFTSFLPAISTDEEKFLSSIENYVIFSQQYDLRYKRLLGKHAFGGFLRYRNYKDNVHWLVDSTNHIELDGLTVEDNIYIRGSQSIFGQKGSVIRRINSGIGNFNYSYDNRYSLSLIADFDNLNEGFYVDKHVLFSSVAVDWDIARENFFPLQRWINAFHLSANWGQAGNYPLNSLSNDLYADSPEYTSDDTLITGIYTDNLANHFLSHEKVTEYNLGTEIAFLSDRIIFSADYFNKENTNLLIQRDIPYYYGGGVFYQNIGEMVNKGVELSLELTPFNRPLFTWTARLGFSSNEQVVTKLYEEEPISFNNQDILYPSFWARENEPLGAITGFSYQGTWDDSIHSDEVNGYHKYIERNGLAYLDADSTYPYRLDINDQVVIGNSVPDFTCHWINFIRYRNFSCEMLWYAVAGVDKFNATRASTYITGTNAEVRSIVMDTLAYVTDNVVYRSSYFVEDASFIRLKTLSFRYEQPKKIASRIGVEYTLSFENLVTFTRYSGYDPEATIYTNNNFTDNAIDKGSYPNPRAVYFSINLSF